MSKSVIVELLGLHVAALNEVAARIPQDTGWDLLKAEIVKAEGIAEQVAANDEKFDDAVKNCERLVGELEGKIAQKEEARIALAGECETLRLALEASKDEALVLRQRIAELEQAAQQPAAPEAPAQG